MRSPARAKPSLGEWPAAIRTRGCEPHFQRSAQQPQSGSYVPDVARGGERGGRSRRAVPQAPDQALRPPPLNRPGSSWGRAPWAPSPGAHEGSRRPSSPPRPAVQPGPTPRRRPLAYGLPDPRTAGPMRLRRPLRQCTECLLAHARPPAPASSSPLLDEPSPLPALLDDPSTRRPRPEHPSPWTPTSASHPPFDRSTPPTPPAPSSNAPAHPAPFTPSRERPRPHQFLSGSLTRPEGLRNLWRQALT